MDGWVTMALSGCTGHGGVQSLSVTSRTYAYYMSVLNNYKILMTKKNSYKYHELYIFT